MCGIYGIFNFNRAQVRADMLNCISGVLRHRGPDSQGHYTKDNIGIGAVRLSIFDLSEKGNQPMFSSDKRYCIVYNGEVYNFIELREQLKLKYKFISGTDTEVVLYSFLEWGQECLHKFNGMFSFAIFDTEHKSLFLARDRFGIKPLYYYLDGERFIFSSELKVFKKALSNLTVNNTAMYNYLVFNRTDYDENTFFKDVKRLPHGHKILIENGKVSMQRWYHLRENLKKGYDSAEELRYDLTDSVKLRLRSDVPVGVCLSGGLDSSCIVSIMKKSLKVNNLQTFSVVYGKGKYGDESEYIDEFKDAIGKNMHKVCLTSEDILSDISDVVYYIEEPVPQTAPFIHYQVMKLAKGKAVVLLDGQGGDEEFAGYHYFFGQFSKELLSKGNISKLTKEIFCYLEKHRSFLGIKSFLYFLLPVDVETRIRMLENSSLSSDFVSQFKKEYAIHERLYRASDLQNSLIQHFEYKLEHLLKWEDRNSMRFSLESRVPFLDHRIVERSLSLPSDRIIKNGETKQILREAMKDILPDKIKRRRSKIGFDNPSAEWFRENNFKDFIFTMLHSDSFGKLPYFDAKKCLDMYEKHIRNRIDASRQIWKWINVELWYNRFIRRKNYD